MLESQSSFRRRIYIVKLAPFENSIKSILFKTEKLSA